MSEAQQKTFYRQVGYKLTHARLRKKITQAELGRRVGLGRTSIVNIEFGRQRFLVHTLASLAKALGVSTEHLLP